MKQHVVIEIDEKVYKHIKEHSGLAYAVEDYLHEVEWAIKNGTPLPKGHGEIKDTRILKADVIRAELNLDYTSALFDSMDICRMIDSVPTIIEADKGVLEQLAEKQNNLSAINKAWSDAIEKNGYVN